MIEKNTDFTFATDASVQLVNGLHINALNNDWKMIDPAAEDVAILVGVYQRTDILKDGDLLPYVSLQQWTLTKTFPEESINHAFVEEFTSFGATQITQDKLNTGWILRYTVNIHSVEWITGTAWVLRHNQERCVLTAVNYGCTNPKHVQIAEDQALRIIQELA